MLGTLIEGLDGVLSAKTVVGDATQIGETIIVPLVDVSFGIGVGSTTKRQDKDGKSGDAGGITGKMSPSAVLVIQNGVTRLVNVKATDNVSRALDLIPEIMEKLKPSKKEVSDEVAVEVAFEDMDNTEKTE